MKKSLMILTVLVTMLAISIPYKGLTKEPLEEEKGSKKEVKSEGLQIAVDVMTVKEHQMMARMMKMDMKMMKMDPKDTHFLSVTLTDEKTGKGVKEAMVQISFLSQAGKEVENKKIMFMPKMGHFGGDVALPEGKIYVKVVATTLKDAHKYTVTFPFAVQ
ncbi:hypothetical protein KJ693_03660 [bacterium]|nr:hypothetical protein [bacterium]MBU1614390.1 hypothetical protein [bacterium]